MAARGLRGMTNSVGPARASARNTCPRKRISSRPECRWAFGQPENMEMARTNVEWCSGWDHLRGKTQVSKARPGPPTRSLESAVCFRHGEARWWDLRLTSFAAEVLRLHLGEWNYFHRGMLVSRDDKRVPQGTPESFELNRHDISVLQFYALSEAERMSAEKMNVHVRWAAV